MYAMRQAAHDAPLTPSEVFGGPAALTSVSPWKGIALDTTVVNIKQSVKELARNSCWRLAQQKNRCLQLPMVHKDIIPAISKISGPSYPTSVSRPVRYRTS